MRDFDQEFDQEFDSSWSPPDEQEDFDTSWKPPTRAIRGPSGLGEEVEGDLPPLASEEKEEFPFTEPMPFSLRESNRPPTSTPTDEYSRVLDRIGGVASGKTDIWGQPRAESKYPLAKLSVFPTDEEESVLPEIKNDTGTWAEGFGKGLYNEFGRWALNPSTMLSSMEAGPAKAVTGLADILKIGESPAAKLAKAGYNKLKTAKLPQTKTPEDVAALETQLRGTLSEPFRPGALETGPIAKVDLSTGIPKPNITKPWMDVETAVKLRNEMEAVRAETAANAARVGAPPPIVQTPPAIAAMPEVAPIGKRARLQELIDKDIAGQLTGPELDEARILDKDLRSQGFPPDSPVEPPPIEAMPEEIIPEIAPSRIDELGQMPVEELESIATPTTLDEVGTPNFGGLTEPIIPEGLADEIPIPEQIPEEVIPEAPIPEPIPESPITAERDLVESQIDETSPISSIPESQEPPLAVPDEAIEPEIVPDTTPEWSPGTSQDDYIDAHQRVIERIESYGESVDEAIENVIGDYGMTRGQLKEYVQGGSFDSLQPKDVELPPIESTPEESPWVGEPIEAPKKSTEDAYSEALDEVANRMDNGEILDDAVKSAAQEHGVDRGQLKKYAKEKQFDWEPKPKTKAELKAEKIAAKKERIANKWAGVSKPSEGPAKMLVRETAEETPKSIRPIEALETPKPKEERPAWISEEGEEIGVPPEDIATSKAKAEEMKRALEGKKRAGSRMSMPEMGREGELPKIESMPEKAPRRQLTTSERWQSQVDALDKANAPDIQYQEILSTGTKTPLRKKETWRERVLGYIDLQRANEAKPKPKGGTTLSSLGAGQGGDILRIAKETAGEISELAKKGLSGPPTPPPKFSWGSPSSSPKTPPTPSGQGKGFGYIAEKGPLDALRESKFGKAVGQAYAESGGKSPWTRSLDVLGNAMKSGMSAIDVSGLLRQGGPLIHKKEWREAAKKTVDLLTDEKEFAKRMGNIKKDPLFKFAKESGLELTGLTTGREEKFANEVMHAIPGYGKLVGASDRAFTGFQNELRFNTFSALLEDAVKAGYKPGREKGKLAKEIAAFVNEASGRGSLGTFEPSAKLMNAVFYSPKFGLSRVQLMNRLNPFGSTFYSQGKFVRKEAVKSVLSMIAMNGTANIATAALGGKVTYDLTNSDFMKNRFGNTRVDFGSGFFQPIVLASRILMDKTTSSMTGKTTDLGSGYGQTSAGDLIGRFAKSKEAPIMGAIAELWSGKDWMGRDKNRAIAAAERFTPLITQDTVDILKDDPRMIPLIIFGLAGASVQTYKRPEKKMELSMPRMNLGL